MRDGYQRAHVPLRSQLTLESLYFGEECALDDVAHLIARTLSCMDGDDEPLRLLLEDEELHAALVCLMTLGHQEKTQVEPAVFERLVQRCEAAGFGHGALCLLRVLRMGDETVRGVALLIDVCLLLEVRNADILRVVEACIGLPTEQAARRPGLSAYDRPRGSSTDAEQQQPRGTDVDVEQDGGAVAAHPSLPSLLCIAAQHREGLGDGTELVTNLLALAARKPMSAQAVAGLVATRAEGVSENVCAVAVNLYCGNTTEHLTESDVNELCDTAARLKGAHSRPFDEHERLLLHRAAGTAPEREGAHKWKPLEQKDPLKEALENSSNEGMVPEHRQGQLSDEMRHRRRRIVDSDEEGSGGEDDDEWDASRDGGARLASPSSRAALRLVLGQLLGIPPEVLLSLQLCSRVCICLGWYMYVSDGESR